ncbi:MULTISPECIES: 16S rRNA (uracil(1498)-N(3))-methyltransferase [unclassified Polaribacter]|uniref:16S rRNA (uracil(1498)-N(3))-methyltransferase n=1 Tax=unclassified Polaribacter TaxID=196858 RepID=UPI0011BE3C82|nr:MULTISPECIES: 16S rRNA (uracil(1498)-N(3))-methyltransferase [unclassified Polaribacter]TXD52052.1 16S rRNA (uracil(1498)-N(3))-methyltransferase [Polaribacter sp. IC063]TXD59774.1 16S rRNA (uracil(1498)-N(3))-methyltransferase [Polaribacter sp. IC066]
MQLFYNPDIDTKTSSITFDKVESRHIVRVLRKKERDTLHITNGKGFLFDAKIIVASDKKCVADIIKVQEKPKPWLYYLHVAIAPTKNNDRIEWFLEKATEIGIDEITPIICSNSERRFVKLERFEKIIQSAMKQSLKFTLPKINEPVKFNEFINQNFEGKMCIAHCEDGHKNLLQSVIKPAEKTTILIGPEGDFSSDEIAKAFDKKFIPISLGESRLRTETAGLVAVNIVSFVNE